MCDYDCLHCTKPDCDNDKVDSVKTDYSIQHNAEWCKRWYSKNAEKKKAYQREYQRAYRQRLKLAKEVG